MIEILIFVSNISKHVEGAIEEGSGNNTIKTQNPVVPIDKACNNFCHQREILVYEAT